MSVRKEKCGWLQLSCWSSRCLRFQERLHFRRKAYLTCGSAPATEASSFHRQARLIHRKTGPRTIGGSEVTDLPHIAFAHWVRKKFAVGTLIFAIVFPFALHAESAAHLTP